MITITDVEICFCEKFNVENFGPIDFMASNLKIPVLEFNLFIDSCLKYDTLLNSVKTTLIYKKNNYII